MRCSNRSLKANLEHSNRFLFYWTYFLSFMDALFRTFLSLISPTPSSFFFFLFFLDKRVESAAEGRPSFDFRSFFSLLPLRISNVFHRRWGRGVRCWFCRPFLPVPLFPFFLPDFLLFGVFFCCIPS